MLPETCENVSSERMNQITIKLMLHETFFTHSQLTLSLRWISRTPTRTISRSFGNSNASFNSIALRPVLPSNRATKTLISPHGEKAMLFLFKLECRSRILNPKWLVASTMTSTGWSFFGKRLSCATCSASLIIVYKETGVEKSTSTVNVNNAISSNFFIFAAFLFYSLSHFLQICKQNKLNAIKHVPKL